jgi:hypothetical protein
MVCFAGNWSVLVIPRAQARVKSLMENLGGSEHICPFSQEIVSSKLVFGPWGKQLTNFAHVKRGTKGSLIYILQFGLIDCFGTLRLFKMKLPPHIHLMPIDLLTQFEVDPLFVPTV